MPITEAQRAAKALERQRAKILGASATLTLYDNAGASLVVLTHSFFVFPKSNIAIGEEYKEAEIAEAAGMTQLIAEKVKTAKLSTMTSTFSASAVEDAMTAARTWKLRLTPFKKG
jgi:hypothetical protein